MIKAQMLIWEIVDANQALLSLTLCSIGIERLWAWFPSNLCLKIILHFSGDLRRTLQYLRNGPVL